MKWIKSYQLFESIEDLDYNLIEDAKDILLPFSDMDMKVSCDYTSKGDEISLNIMTTKENAFDINEYKNDIDRLLSYMKENNWGIWDFKVGVVEKKEDWSGTQLWAKNQDILSYKNGPIQYDKVKNPTFWITAEFVKIVYAKAKVVKESIDIDIDIIKDILLDLEDDLFTVEINSRYKAGYTEIIITRYVSGHNGGLMGFEFIWRDIKDTIFRLMDYYYTENDKPEINSNKIVLSNREKMAIKDLYTNSPFRLFGHIRNGFAASDRMVEFGIGFTSEEDFNNAQDNSIGDYTIFEKIKILIKR